MAIDVGEVSADRGGRSFENNTVITMANPANADGVIDEIDFWENDGDGGPIDCASFTDEGSSVFSTRDSSGDIATNGGELNAVAPGDFTAFDIVTGDYLGAYIQVRIEFDSSGGGGYRYESGDYVPCSSVSFSSNYSAAGALSLYGRGTEEAGGANALTGVLYGPLVGSLGGPI